MIPTRSVDRLARVLLSLAVSLLAGSAWAGDTALAEKLFHEGQALMDDGKVAEACIKFQESMNTDASGGTALNLGRCHRQEGKTATALADYQRAAKLLRADGDEERASFAEDEVAKLEPSVPTLRVDVTPTPGLTVTVDGSTLEPSAYGVARPLDPGDHRVDASAEGHESLTVDVKLAETGGATNVMVPALKPVLVEAAGDPSVNEPSASSGPSPLIIGGGVALGVGAAAAIAGGVVGGLVLSDASKARSDDSLCGADELCTETGQSHIARAKRKALAADVLIGVGAGVAAAGVVMIVVGSLGDSDEQVSVLPAVGPTGAGLTLSARF
jgi:hypothetical protein